MRSEPSESVILLLWRMGKENRIPMMDISLALNRALLAPTSFMVPSKTGSCWLVTHHFDSEPCKQSDNGALSSQSKTVKSVYIIDVYGWWQCTAPNEPGVSPSRAGWAGMVWLSLGLYRRCHRIDCNYYFCFSNVIQSQFLSMIKSFFGGN